MTNWTRFSVSRLVNAKNVFFAEFSGQKVVLKKLAHNYGWYLTLSRDPIEQALKAKNYRKQSNLWTYDTSKLPNSAGKVAQNVAKVALYWVRKPSNSLLIACSNLC